MVARVGGMVLLLSSGMKRLSFNLKDIVAVGAW